MRKRAVCGARRQGKEPPGREERGGGASAGIIYGGVEAWRRVAGHGADCLSGTDLVQGVFARRGQVFTDETFVKK